MTINDDLEFVGPPYAQTHGMLPGAASKRFIIIHSTENTASARDEASYARRRTDGTSSHYYADGREVVQSTDTRYSANGVGSWQGNTRGIHYEVCGRASWSRSTWLDRVDWPALAAAICQDLADWDIPARVLTVGQLADLEKGITTHDACRRAFGGTTHTDPGGSFPMDYLISLIEEDDMPTTDEIAEAVAKAVWSWDPGRDHASGILNSPDRADAPEQGGSNVTVQTSYGLTDTWHTVRGARSELAALRRDAMAGQAALLAAVRGEDVVGAFTAALEDAAVRERAERAAEAEAERVERAEEVASILAAVRDLASGGATADAIVDELARRLGGE